MAQQHSQDGWRLLDAGDNEAARAKFLEAIAANPRDTDALIGLSKALARLGRVSESLDAALKVIDLDPENPEAHYGAAWAYIHMREREKAELHAQKAVTLAPNVAKYHLMAAAATLRKNRKNMEIALWHLEVANRLESGGLKGRWRLALIYLRVFAGFAYPIQRLLMVWAMLATLYSCTLSAAGRRWWFLVASLPFLAVAIYNLSKRRYYRAIWSFGLYLLWAVSTYLFVAWLSSR